jgi:hypothetical protein
MAGKGQITSERASSYKIIVEATDIVKKFVLLLVKHVL